MTRKQAKITILTFSLWLVLINLPFLPGPNFLNGTAQLFFTIGQLIGMVGLIGAPLGIIWIAVNRKKNLSLFRPLIFTIIFFAPTISVIFLTNSLRDLSRSIAIKNGNKLIRQVEDFKLINGYYPDHIDSIGFNIPNSWIIGVENYSYTKDNTNFQLTFNQNIFLGFNFEIVTYNNMNQQKAQGEQQTLYETIDKNWKYEVFD